MRLAGNIHDAWRNDGEQGAKNSRSGSSHYRHCESATRGGKNCGASRCGYTERVDTAGSELWTGSVRPAQRRRYVEAREIRAHDLLPFQGRLRVLQRRRGPGQCRVDLRGALRSSLVNQELSGVLSRSCRPLSHSPAGPRAATTLHRSLRIRRAPPALPTLLSAVATEPGGPGILSPSREAAPVVVMPVRTSALGAHRACLERQLQRFLR